MIKDPWDDHGGPAFPITASHDAPTYKGMSLRDWFAGQALASMRPTEDDLYGGQDLYPEVAATFAYCIADAMLEQRKKEFGE